jgi:RNA polymerase sigma-70 factor (ECF subfamily)
MSQSDESSHATRASLLGRLKSLGDHSSWQQFFDTYWRLIYGVALKAGLRDAEAQDVVQETIITAAKHLPCFHYDPKVTIDALADYRSAPQASPVSQEDEISTDDDATATALLDGLSGGTAPDLEAVWSEEWKKQLMAAAIERVKSAVRPEQFQIFKLYAIKGIPVDQVAKLLGVNAARVYLAKHRVAALVRKEVVKLEKGMI